MAVRCSACGQWIKTIGGAHNCPGSGKAKEELLAAHENNQNEASESHVDDVLLPQIMLSSQPVEKA